MERPSHPNVWLVHARLYHSYDLDTIPTSDYVVTNLHLNTCDIIAKSVILAAGQLRFRWLPPSRQDMMDGLMSASNHTWLEQKWRFGFSGSSRMSHDREIVEYTCPESRKGLCPLLTTYRQITTQACECVICCIRKRIVMRILIFIQLVIRRIHFVQI